MSYQRTSVMSFVSVEMTFVVRSLMMYISPVRTYKEYSVPKCVPMTLAPVDNVHVCAKTAERSVASLHLTCLVHLPRASFVTAHVIWG